MLAKPLLNHILDDEALTRGLADPEARVLVEWLVERAENLAELGFTDSTTQREIHRLCRRARAIGRFVSLWCHQEQRGAAVQLVGAERFTWPLPRGAMDPYELMQFILDWEAKQLQA